MNAEKMIEESNRQVVAKVGNFTYTRGELKALFDLVANKEHWKNPISCNVKLNNEYEVEGVKEAIVFFTGSEPIVIRKMGSNNEYLVKADGYFLTIGA